MFQVGPHNSIKLCPCPCQIRQYFSTKKKRQLGSLGRGVKSVTPFQGSNLQFLRLAQSSPDHNRGSATLRTLPQKFVFSKQRQCQPDLQVLFASCLLIVQAKCFFQCLQALCRIFSISQITDFFPCSQEWLFLQYCMVCSFVIALIWWSLLFPSFVTIFCSSLLFQANLHCQSERKREDSFFLQAAILI